MKNNKKSIFILILLIIITIILSVILVIKVNNKKAETKVNLTDLTYISKNNTEYSSIKKYSQDDFETFYNDYKNGNLPSIYLTEFVFDGVSMYKAPDLDDFIEDGNDTKLKAVSINAININTTGDIYLSGNITGMILVNTNDINDDINIILDNVNINTDSKKVPAIYVYNKNMNYTDHKVTINALENTKNYVTGGKFKKVSLVPIEDLASYTSNYSGDYKTYYETYTNYYGVYTKEEINNILFARLTADREDLADGDPYYYYKGSGAISSDIDLYFEGKGYLEVTSNKKEGIETKGNLTFSGGTGDYYITALDDCLNTTMDGNDYRNALTIDVDRLVARVSLDADEGDAIDSNGTLTINGGTIIALAKPGSDAGIDSSKGTYINGGVVISTGDMYDEVSSESKQNFIVLSFGERVVAGDEITLLNSDNKAVFSYGTDRTYTNLIYSSSDLKEGTYYVYKGGTYNEKGYYGVLTDLDSYSTEGATQLGYSSTGSTGMGGMQGNNGMPSMPENGNMGEPPTDNGMQNNKGERPDMPNNMGQNPNGDNMTPPDMETQSEMFGNMGNTTASNKDFTINGISNIFSGVATYKEG